MYISYVMYFFMAFWTYPCHSIDGVDILKKQYENILCFSGGQACLSTKALQLKL